MENNRVLVVVNFTGTKSINNSIYDIECKAEKELELDRRFISNLETAVCDFKELGTVTIFFGNEEIGKLDKGGYIVGKEYKNFERFGGKIAKDFFTSIDDRIAELEKL